MNRSDLIDDFGISVNEASTDLNRYISMASENRTHDKSVRTYVRGSQFTPLFLKPDVISYLSQLLSVGDGNIERADTWIGQFPSFDATPTPVRTVIAETLGAVVAAILRSEAMEIQYQSLSSPEPKWRWIAPHAIGFDGFRWHARACCEIDKTFKDFLLSWIIEVGTTRSSDSDAENDSDWQEYVVLEIGTHPELSDLQKAVIPLDYGMRAGSAEIKVRKAFLYYTLKRLGVDTDASARRPQDQQIVLVNNAQVCARGGIGKGLE